MFCGSCGKQIPDGSGFCPSCGAAASGGAAHAAATGGSGPSAAAAQRAKLEAQFKAGSQDAMQAFMVLLKDPVGGIAKSYAMFDQGRALIVGAIFAGVFAVAAMLSVLNPGGLAVVGVFGGSPQVTAAAALARAATEAARSLGADLSGYGVPSTGSLMLKALVAGLVFAAVLVGACIVARIIFKGTSQLAGEVYTAGASLLPMAVATLVGLLLAALGLYGVIPLVSIFALAWMILMLNSGCQKILGISDSKTSLAVPVILAIAALGMSLIVRGMA